MTTLSLETQWIARLKLRAEAQKLKAEAEKLRAEAENLWAEGAEWIEGAKVRVEGARLRAEAENLWAEGEKLWAEAILSVYGKITLEWKYRGGMLDCHLGNGEVYLGDMKIEDCHG